ncbi:hypothetical protein BDV96DRAFT_570332 [Lophiotrema nucula]|uniref:Carboxylesterase family protein n=1 Tax=Lophiotrema nucula TaxID=690887 RepID=A0A6A5ZGK3_9PLEO|nr:hypothetical protein BDV96DRAFT_570332 [Lophiotrema nucula]
MRLTRAAQRAVAIETEDASNASLPPTPSKERVPLGEVSANTIAEPTVDVELAAEVKKMPPKKGKKGGKKGTKSKKTAEEEVLEVANAGEPQVILEDARQAAGSPASDAAVDELASGPTNDIVQVPMNDQRPASPPSRAVRRTRRQLALEEEEELSKSQRAAAPPAQPKPVPEPTVEDGVVEEPVAEVEDALPEPDTQEETIAQEPEVQVQEEPTAEVQEQEVEPQQTQEDTVAAAQEPIIVAPEVEITTEPEPKVLTSAKPCEDDATPTTSRTPSRAPSRSPNKSPMRLEESIEAIDALEEALEQVGKAVVFDASADEKSPRKANFPRTRTPARTPNARLRADVVVKRSPLAAPKLSRTPAQPKSLKPSTTTNVPKPIASLKAPAPRASTSLARSQSTRAAPAKEVRNPSGEVTDYLASKRRPISMQFPAPPPPSKSAKPVTKPTFQLPGDAVAAKLKAQKEDRLKREEEEAAAKKAAFKARPPPTRKNVPAVAVRQTAASKARENVINGVPIEKAVRKVTPSGFQKEVIGGLAREVGGVTIPPPPKPSSTTTTTTLPKKRPSSVIITSRPAFSASVTSSTSFSRPNSNRNSMILPNSKSTVTAADAAAQRLKAREIFNRDRSLEASRVLDRKEKEEAAKRARAEAAERGRIASREWAEKQRLKALGRLAGGGLKGAEAA